MELDVSKIVKRDYMEKQLKKISGKVIYLYGAGSFGKEIYYFLKENGIDICAFLDLRADEIREYCGKPVYNLNNSILKQQKNEAVVLFSIVMDKDVRKKVMEEIKKSGFRYIEEAQFYRSIQVVPDDFKSDGALENYYVKRKNKIREAYGFLEDEKSRAVYRANIKAHFLKDYSECSRWEDPMEEQYFPPDIKFSSGYSRFIDCGGFIGDTVEKLLNKKEEVQEVAAFEPDIGNFRRLAAFCRDKGRKIICYPCAVADKTDFQRFSAARGSGAISEDGESTILSISLDEVLANFAPTFIKMDIEGAEIKALWGAKRMICESLPDLAVCVYHNINHLWDIILLLKSWNLGYNFYLRSYNAYAMETVLYAVKGENRMNTVRTELFHSLPLNTPFSVHVFPSFYCNFKCNYCLHSLGGQELSKKNFKRQYMDFQTYKKAIDDVRMFPDKLKALIFAGHGEPLLHKEIADMVAYAKQTQKFERIEIVTNGSLLVPGLSEQLIEAGLDRLRISLQGVNAKEYENVSGVNIDFEKFVDNIRYFYEHKRNTEVYIKIIDIALKEDGDEEQFKHIFESISDITAIEYAIPFVKEIDYTDIGELSKKCKQGHKQASHICSMPFYMMVINPDGNIVPCCATDFPMIFGNVKEENLVDIWNSKVRNLCLKRQLGGVDKIPICKECNVPAFGLQAGDYLDGHEEELLRRYMA